MRICSSIGLFCASMFFPVLLRAQNAGTTNAVPVITLVAADAAAAETPSGHTPNPGVFVITRSGPTNHAVTVSLALSGTAVGGVDFQPLPLSVVLAAGKVRAEIPVRPVDDTLVEGEETVVLRLLTPPCAQIVPTPPECYVLGQNTEAVVRIADNDSPPPPVVLPVITVASVVSEVPEGLVSTAALPGGLVFALRRHENLNLQTVVRVQWGGAAVRGVDYAPMPDQFIFPAGQSVLNITVPPIDDHTVEGNESVLLSLIPPDCGNATLTSSTTCYRVGTPAHAGGVVVDDDSPGENHPPYAAWLSPVSGSTWTAPPELRLAAAAKDSDGAIRRVTFLANGQVLGVATNLSSVLANFTSGPSSGAYEFLWSHPQPGEYRLQAEAEDNDGAVVRTPAAMVRILAVTNLPRTVVSVVAADREAMEPSTNSDAPNRGVFRFHRSGDLSLPLIVQYRVEGTATGGVDYTALPGSVEFPAGQAVREVPVTALADNLLEGPENVRVVLVAPFCAQIFPIPPECYLVGVPSSDQVVIGEHPIPLNRPPVALVVHPWQGQVFPAPADLRLLAEAYDVDGTVVRLVFLDGEHVLGEGIPVEDSTNLLANTQGVLEPRPAHRRFFFEWTRVPAGRHVIRAAAYDDDTGRGVSAPVEIKVVEMTTPPVVTLMASDAEAAEPSPDSSTGNPAIFTVRRTGPTNTSLRVFLHFGGSARPGLDYPAPDFPGVLIPAGAETKSLVLHPLDDSLPEGPESIEIAVVPPRWLTPGADGCLLPVQYVVGEPGRASARLLDNDLPATNHAPRVRLVRPEANARFEAPARIGLAAEAVDLDGGVTAVDFFANGVPVGSLPGQPRTGTNSVYTLLWEDVPPGEYHLTARATDALGAQGVSESVTVVVREETALPEVEVFTVDPHASEHVNGANGTNVARFRFRRTGDALASLTVRYSVGGTASNGVDYARLDGLVTLAAGKMSEVVEVRPMVDQEVEPEPESVIVKVIVPDPAAYTLGRRVEAAASISDFDSDISSRPLHGGEWMMSLPAPGEGLFSVQVSENLLDWTHVTTVPAENGRVRFVDPAARTQGRRFYQVVPAVLDLDNLND